MKRLGLVLLAVMALFITVASADTPPSFLLKWGSKGTGSGQFRSPRGVAVDAGGFVYVADRMNARVQKFDSNGGFVTQWQSPSPHGIAVSPSGNIYVTSQVDNRVDYYSPSGIALGSWGSAGTGTGHFTGPTGITADEDNNVYVIDTNDRVQRFSGTGTFVAQWGAHGIGDGQFSSAEGIASDRNGHIIVSDSDRIQEFTTNGGWLAGWNSNGRVRFVACNSAGDIYASDWLHDNISKYSFSGTLLATFGQCCTDDGEFLEPAGVAVTSDETIYVADSYDGFQAGNNRVQKFGTVSTKASRHSWGAIKSRYQP